MLDFNGLHADLASLQQAIVQELLEIQGLMDPSADEAQLALARTKVQELTTAVQGMVTPLPAP